jgi:hypothetical protein
MPYSFARQARTKCCVLLGCRKWPRLPLFGNEFSKRQQADSQLAAI